MGTEWTLDFLSNESILFANFVSFGLCKLEEFLLGFGDYRLQYIPTILPMSFKKSLKGLLLSFALLSAIVISIRSSLKRASFMILLKKIFCSFFGIVLNAVRKNLSRHTVCFHVPDLPMFPFLNYLLYHIIHILAARFRCNSLGTDCMLFCFVSGLMMNLTYQIIPAGLFAASELYLAIVAQFFTHRSIVLVDLFIS